MNEHHHRWALAHLHLIADGGIPDVPAGTSGWASGVLAVWNAALSLSEYHRAADADNLAALREACEWYVTKDGISDDVQAFWAATAFAAEALRWDVLIGGQPFPRRSEARHVLRHWPSAAAMVPQEEVAS